MSSEQASSALEAVTSSSSASAPAPASTSAAAPAANVQAQVSDTDIMAQAEAIRREVADTQALVEDKEVPEVLLAQYADNPRFTAKLHDFASKYAGIRRTRGDGNCFYRCFLISIGEYFVTAKVAAPGGAASGDASAAGEGVGGGAGAAAAASPASSTAQATYERLLKYVEASCEKLLALGYPDVTLPDFHEAMLEYLQGLAAPGATAESAVYDVFRDYMRGSYIITYLRCLTSLEMLANEDAYLPYVMGLAPHCATVKQFCDAEVEAVNTDADQLQIIALTRAWGLGVTIAYLDASATDKCAVLTIPEDSDAASYPRIVSLLYRPGHYDVAYPK